MVGLTTVIPMNRFTDPSISYLLEPGRIRRPATRSSFSGSIFFVGHAAFLVTKWLTLVTRHLHYVSLRTVGPFSGRSPRRQAQHTPSAIRRSGLTGMILEITADLLATDLSPAEPSLADVASCETALACLFRLGAQNGVYAGMGAGRRR
jgi:hypothetical protein